MQTITRTVVIAAVLALAGLSDSAFAGSPTAPATKASPTTVAAATVHQRLSGTLGMLKVGERVTATKDGDQLASLSVRGK